MEIYVRKKKFKRVLRSIDAPFSDFVDDMIGNPYHTRKYLFFGKPVTQASIRSSFYFALLSKYVDLDKVSSIMDIGGGFGALTGRIGLRYPQMKLYFVDLPEYCILAYYYLETKLGNAELIYQDSTTKSCRVSILLPWVISNINEPVDLCINTASFQHMQAPNFHFYFSQLQRLRVKMIFSVNREIAGKCEDPYLDYITEYGYKLEMRVQLSQYWKKMYVNIFRLQ